MWPDSGYDDDELEEWINDTLQEAQLPDIFRKDAECTRLVEQHPDLMDAKLWFDGEDEDIVENMTVEGRPFEDALKIVSQNPGITTMDMKARLQELNKLDMDRTGWHKTENRITDILLKENHKGHQIVRCKIDGEQQVFHPLTKQQSNDLSMISDKDLRKAFLIDVLRDVYKDKLSQQNQKETGLKI